MKNSRRKKVKEDAISILRGISIRMPLMIYGAKVENEDEELTIAANRIRQMARAADRLFFDFINAKDCFPNASIGGVNYNDYPQ